MILLQEEKYAQAYGELRNWRDSAYGISKSKNPKDGILPFVTGLRLSAQIIYIIREILEGSTLVVDWGHIINKDGLYCKYSNECDIVIYKTQPNNVLRTWNGDRKNSIMSFKFIKHDAVVGVISCKSYITKNSIDLNYPKQMKSFTNNLWIFAECCGPKSEKSIKTAAKKAGYKGFWNLYTWSPKQSAKENKEAWKDFEKTIIALAG